MRAAVVCLLIGVAASQAVYQRPQNQDCVANSTIPTNTPTNFFPGEFQAQGLNTTLQASRVNVSFAQGFSVTYFDTYKIVTNSQVNETYVLYQCGLAAPNNAALPPGSKVFSIPLTSVAIGDTVPLAFIDLLGVDARLQSASQYATNACGQKLVGCGKVAPNTTTQSDSALLQADFGPLVDGITLSAANNVSLTFAFTAASDPGVLNRAEWIKFLGLFFNQDALASQVFNNINSSYYSIRDDIRVCAFMPGQHAEHWDSGLSCCFKLAAYNEQQKAEGKNMVGVDVYLSDEDLKIKNSLYPRFKEAKEKKLRRTYWRGCHLFVEGVEVKP